MSKEKDEFLVELRKVKPESGYAGICNKAADCIEQLERKCKCADEYIIAQAESHRKEIISLNDKCVDMRKKLTEEIERLRDLFERLKKWSEAYPYLERNFNGINQGKHRL